MLYRQVNPKESHHAGFSMMELILSILVIGFLASVAAIAVSRVNDSAQHSKVNSDVTALNSAIRIYLANGGNLDGVSDPVAVLQKLKSSRSKSDKKLHAGAPSGKMIDARVSIKNVAANSRKARARYNSASQRFEVVENQEGFEFILDEALSEVIPNMETRTDSMNYARNSTWVWDHTSTVNPNPAAGPSTFGTNPNPTNSAPSVPEPEPVPDPDPDPGTGPDPDPDPDPDPVLPRLPKPAIDKENGPHPEDDFPLPVTITNLPSSAEGTPMYQINSDPWATYAGPVSIPMNSSIRVQFLSADPTKYRDSNTTYAYFYPVPDSLSGSVEGNFGSPSGGPNLVYSIENSGSRFTHGDPVYMLDGQPIDSGTPNALEFVAQSFSDIAPGESFKLGEMSYHNGNSYYDSHATAVTLGITIVIPDRGETINFDLNLDLVNTENDPDDPAASADYVKITNLKQNISLVINGVSYKIALSFGATDSFGFSSSSQFHVYEGATGAGELLATFLPN